LGCIMGKNIVICCDGTGNEVEGNLSNVLKLFRIVQKNDRQHVYYSPGIGTIGSDDSWNRFKQDSKSIFELATGYGLDVEIIDAYRFICELFEDNDDLYFFEFSRGAYTVRVLAGFIHMIGLLRRDQMNVVKYALTAYKRSSHSNDFSIAWNFSRIIGGRRSTIKFVGVWDTVASILVPRSDRLLPTRQTLPYTRTNKSVEIFRQAMAIDERRRMFRLNRWIEPQPFVANAFDPAAVATEQDVRQVWFAGSHSDIGGGCPESQSGLSKFPLAWMIDEAVAHGLKINVAMRNSLVLGQPRVGEKNVYVAPDCGAQLHDSLTPLWRPLEWFPKSMQWNEWPRPNFLNYYIPKAEPRRIADPQVRPRIHTSAIERKETLDHAAPTDVAGVDEINIREHLSPNRRANAVRADEHIGPDLRTVVEAGGHAVMIFDEVGKGGAVSDALLRKGGRQHRVESTPGGAELRHAKPADNAPIGGEGRTAADGDADAAVDLGTRRPQPLQHRWMHAEPGASTFEPSPTPLDDRHVPA
jgi:uncharacterized protein (DUF2235 family)